MQALLEVFEEESSELSEEDLHNLQAENTAILRLSTHLNTLSLALAGRKGENHG